MVPPSELALLIEHSDAAGREAIRAAAVAAGLMWRCRNSTCPTYNQRTDELCGGCGRDRDGRPLSDVQPGLYAAPDELWEQLRNEVFNHFCQNEFAPLPDAVTFPWVSRQDTAPWSLTELVIHYGGFKREYLDDLSGTWIEELLEEIALAVEPGYLEHLRITLPH
ncbi:hypothetical protein ACFCY8_42955 [Streptomyces noursei]|uniref:hypothetical protein n=1 Tax=Streptomyces noursei TaxID=1971 RepID=UPI0035DA3194